KFKKGAMMNEAKTLLVAIRGWFSTGDLALLKRMGILKYMGSEIPDIFTLAITSKLKYVEVLRPELEMDLYSTRSPESLAQDIYNQIEKKISESSDIKSIVLLGYSAGSVLARRVFSMAHGAKTDATIDESKKADWADLIDRIIILSGITRGWEFSSATPATIRFIGPILEVFLRGFLGLKQLLGNSKKRAVSIPMPLVKFALL
ncbi:MAG TPA: hypothetical protein PK389_03190, partial [Gammaproteobacteria bacterium]|nr:hypothetical protein [Gammaproteobacteria bacterium]